MASKAAKRKLRGFFVPQTFLPEPVCEPADQTAWRKRRRKIDPAIRGRSPQQRRVLFQPAFGRCMIRADRLHLPPEGGGMVQLPPVHEFVENDIVAHRAGQLDQPPVQRNGAAPRTGAPTGTLVAHRHAHDGHVMPVRQFRHARGQFPGGQPAEMPLDDRPPNCTQPGAGLCRITVSPRNQIG